MFVFPAVAYADTTRQNVNTIVFKDKFGFRFGLNILIHPFGVFFFAFLGGTLETLKYEFRLALQDSGPGGLWFGFIPFFIGTLIAGTAITILITYLVRLTIPFFKKIHEKANK